MAFDLVLKAAKQGSSWAQQVVGQFHMNGVGLEQDYVSSRRWFLRAAKQGNTMTMCWIGDFYLNGHGVKKNVSHAKDWFLRGAVLNNAHCQLRLAFIFEKSSSTHEHAYNWYLRSAKQDNPLAQYYLFDHLMTG